MNHAKKQENVICMEANEQTAERTSEKNQILDSAKTLDQLLYICVKN